MEALKKKCGNCKYLFSDATTCPIYKGLTKDTVVQHCILFEYNVEGRETILITALRKITELRDLNPNLQYNGNPSCAEDVFINYYCQMGDIAKKALKDIKDDGVS